MVSFANILAKTFVDKILFQFKFRRRLENLTHLIHDLWEVHLFLPAAFIKVLSHCNLNGLRMIK